MTEHVDFKVKPEGAAAASSSAGGGGGKGNITSQLNMSLDEAHLILNVKKDDPMEIIQKVRPLCCLPVPLLLPTYDC